MISLHKKAFAKLNLSLYNLGKRLDNYHELYSQVIFIKDLYDIVTIKESTKAEGSLYIENNYNDTDISQDNILIKIRHDFEQSFVANKKKFDIYLEKNIPIAGGLGGGSADAAALIDLLCDFYNIELTLQEKINYSMNFGSDIACCLYGEDCIFKGRGEIIQPNPVNISGFMLIVNPMIEVSTGQIFSMIEGHNTKPESFPLYHNDLQRYATNLYPEISDLLKIINVNAQIAMMSGSGASCFAVFDNKSDAENAACNLPSNYWHKVYKIK